MNYHNMMMMMMNHDAPPPPSQKKSLLRWWRWWWWWAKLLHRWLTLQPLIRLLTAYPHLIALPPVSQGGLSDDRQLQDVPDGWTGVTAKWFQSPYRQIGKLGVNKSTATIVNLSTAVTPTVCLYNIAIERFASVEDVTLTDGPLVRISTVVSHHWNWMELAWSSASSRVNHRLVKCDHKSVGFWVYKCKSNLNLKFAPLFRTRSTNNTARRVRGRGT